MITIVSGTNRIGSYTLKVAKEYQKILNEKKIDSKIFSLEGINVLEKNGAFEKLEQEILIPTTIFIFIVPEYNGSIPGVFKLLIDNCKPSDTFYGKKALLVGISTGRAGNLRGLDHLTNILAHLKITVHPNKLPISIVHQLMDDNGNFTDKNTIGTIHNQLDEFLNWL